MPRPPRKHRRRLLIGLLAVSLPPLAWGLVLAVLPTGWARARVVARLAEAAGRPVALGSVRVGFFGGVDLRGLTVAAPGRPEDPWLRVARARVNISLAQLLYGHFDPTDLSLDGVTLRVLRRGDGSLEVAESDPASAARPARAGGTRAGGPWPTDLGFRFAGATVRLIDEATDSRLELTGVEGLGTWEGHRATVQVTRSSMNGGPFDLAARLDRSGPAPAFEAEMHATQVVLGPDMSVLAYLAPVLAGAPDGVEGRLDLNLYLKGQGAGRLEWKRSLVGRGSVALDPVRLDGSALAAGLAQSLGVSPRSPVGSVHSDFTIRGGRVVTDRMRVGLAGVAVGLSGWTDFDGRLDYRLGLDQLAGRLPSEARDLLADLQITPQDLTVVRITGTLDRPALSAEGSSPRGVAPGPDQADRLRQLARRLRGRVFR